MKISDYPNEAPADSYKVVGTGNSGKTKNFTFSSIYNYIYGRLQTVFSPLASPAFTGVPTAPTASAGTNTDQVATTAFVRNAVGGGSDTYVITACTGVSVDTPVIAASAIEMSLDPVDPYTGFDSDVVTGVLISGPYNTFGSTIFADGKFSQLNAAPLMELLPNCVYRTLTTPLPLIWGPNIYRPYRDDVLSVGGHVIRCALESIGNATITFPYIQGSLNSSSIVQQLSVDVVGTGAMYSTNLYDSPCIFSPQPFTFIAGSSTGSAGVLTINGETWYIVNFYYSGGAWAGQGIDDTITGSHLPEPFRPYNGGTETITVVGATCGSPSSYHPTFEGTGDTSLSNITSITGIVVSSIDGQKFIVGTSVTGTDGFGPIEITDLNGKTPVFAIKEVA